jgi:AcrR family transcriptional regulator
MACSRTLFESRSFEAPMPPQQSALRRGERRRDARRSILDSATELLRRDGADGLTMRRVAARSGCSAPTLYHYFRDKTALLDAMLDAAFAELVAELDRLGVERDPLAALRTRCLAIVRFCLANPIHFRLMSEARPDDAPPLSSHAQAQQRLESPLARLAAAGRLRVELETAKQSLWSLLHGLVSVQATRPEVTWSPDLAQVSFDALFRGLVRPARSRR